MDELSLIFADFDESQMSELLESEESEYDEALSERIKERVIPELFGEGKGKVKKFPLRKVVATAAAIIAVVASAVAVAMYYEPVDSALPVLTTTAPGESTSTTDTSLSPLMLAISSGNEGLIETLIKNAIYVTEETLSFALEYIDVISYGSIKTIAEKTVETVGATGLDGLLESAILGDSERALRELKERENMLMTPTEKLAFFFSVAFCDSKVVNEFLQRGYDETMTDSKGNTTLDIAEKYGNNATAEFLKSIESENTTN